MHTKLKKLGFDLGDEINLQVNGPKTTAALKKLKQQYEKEGGTGNWSDNIGKLIKGIVNSSTVQSILAATKSASDSLGFTQTKKDKKIAVAKDTDAAKVITFFKQKGLTVSQSAGIAGNIAVESGFNPTAIGDNGTSYGLAQWHLDRWENLKQWCSKNGYEPSSISGQLEFLWWELQNYESSALSDLKQQTNPSAAAESFASKFERPSYVSPIRAKNAENFYNDFTKYAASKI